MGSFPIPYQGQFSLGQKVNYTVSISKNTKYPNSILFRTIGKSQRFTIIFFFSFFLVEAVFFIIKAWECWFLSSHNNPHTNQTNGSHCLDPDISNCRRIKWISNESGMNQRQVSMGSVMRRYWVRRRKLSAAVRNGQNMPYFIYTK